MTGENPPKQPNASRERREQTNRISEISHRIADMGNTISAAIRNLGDHIFALTHQIQADNKTTDTREKELNDRSFWYVKWGTRSTIVLSVFSLFSSVAAVFVVNKQLDSMRIEQRAWIKIEHGFEPIAENKPLFAIVNIKNIGKTPAKRVEQQYTVQKVISTNSPDLHPVDGYSRFIPILSPDVAADNRVPMFTETYDLLNPALLTKADVVDLNSGKAYVAVVGKITYIDVYGISHWIDYCHWQSFRRGEYEVRKCVEYNNVDNN